MPCGASSIGALPDPVKASEIAGCLGQPLQGEDIEVSAPASLARARNGRNCWIAPSAAIINAVSIGDRAFVGLGAVVTKDVPADAVVAGNPARSTGAAP